MTLNKEYIQQFAEPNFGRRLSDIELHRFSQEAWNGNDGVFFALCDLMDAVIEVITDEKNSDWNDTDNDFLKKLNPKERKMCLKEHAGLIKEDI